MVNARFTYTGIRNIILFLKVYTRFPLVHFWSVIMILFRAFSVELCHHFFVFARVALNTAV